MRVQLTYVKAAHRMLVKLTPGANPIKEMSFWKEGDTSDKKCYVLFELAITSKNTYILKPIDFCHLRIGDKSAIHFNLFTFLEQTHSISA